MTNVSTVKNTVLSLVVGMVVLSNKLMLTFINFGNQSGKGRQNISGESGELCCRVYCNDGVL